MMKQTPWRQLGTLLIVAFVLRLAAGWAWQSRLAGQAGPVGNLSHAQFGMGDSESYWVLATAIATGQPYQYGSADARVFRTPGYPLLLAPIIRLADGGRDAVLLARAEAALLGTLAVLGVWWLTRLLFDPPTAILAAGLAAFYPGAIALSALVLSEAPFCPLMLLQLGLWILAWRAPSVGGRTALGFCAGLAAGAATLMRPSWLLFTPFAAAVGMLACGGADIPVCREKRPLNGRQECLPHRDGWRSATLLRHAMIAFWMMLGLMTAMLPWWIRNAYVIGHFVPTTLQVGASLYDGLNPKATGASNLEEFVPRFAAAEERRAAEPGADHRDPLELRLDRRMRDAAWDWAWANPGRALKLAGVKFLRMWNVWPNEPRLASWPIGLAVFFTYTPLLIFAIIGAWRTFDRGWPYVLCWLPAVYLTLLHMVFVSSLRYREPAMLALLALAAGGMEIGIRDWGLGIRD